MYFLKRFFALLVDSIILGLVCMPVFWWTLSKDHNIIHYMRNSFVNTIFATLILSLYFIVSEIIFGSTFGKAIFRLKVVSNDGGSISIIQIILRNVLRILDHGVLPCGLLIFFSKKRKRVGDLISKTKVIEL